MDLDSLLEKSHIAINNNNNNAISYRASKVKAKSYPDIKLQNVQVGTRITKKLKEKIIQYVVLKHGKLNGVYSLEIEEMLEIGLAYKQQQTTTMTISNSKHRSDVNNNLMRIRTLLRAWSIEGRNYPVFHLNNLNDTISDVMKKGNSEADKRTKRKYLKIILEGSKEIGTSRFDISYFLNDNEGNEKHD